MEKILGSHVNLKAPDFYLGTVQSALDFGENAFMFYTGAPQNTFRKPVETLKIEEGRALLKASGIDEKNVIVHAPYIINLGNKGKPETYQLGKEFLEKELHRVAAFHVDKLVLHPGSHLGNGIEWGLESLVSALDEVLAKDGTNVTICLETMAGKGSEIGSSFEEISYVLNHVKNKDRIGVCLDTCHISDAGYDVHDVDGVLEEFDRVIGLEHLKVIHLNDSKNPRGSHKDRHENLGFGEVGYETLLRYVDHPRLAGIPKILETPYFNEKPPYAKEVSMLRSGVYEDGWRDAL